VGPFVDCHSHVLATGDDGARVSTETRALCREAARHGTGILFATPHVWPHLPLSPDREAEIRRAYAAARPEAGLELRLGFELTPSVTLLRDDPRRYMLEGTEHVLMEVPFTGPPDLLWQLGNHVEAAGLRPVIAHPERSQAALDDPGLARALVERGWTLQVNSTSLLGYHGREEEELGWVLLEEGLAGIVASDGHRAARPPRLDEAWDRVRARLGDDAVRFFDGSALGLALDRPASAAA